MTMSWTEWNDEDYWAWKAVWFTTAGLDHNSRVTTLQLRVAQRSVATRIPMEQPSSSCESFQGWVDYTKPASHEESGWVVYTTEAPAQAPAYQEEEGPAPLPNPNSEWQGLTLGSSTFSQKDQEDWLRSKTLTRDPLDIHKRPAVQILPLGALDAPVGAEEVESPIKKLCAGVPLDAPVDAEEVESPIKKLCAGFHATAL